jgi:catechol 2,3-dioxygenase-like lactoylglutathione lyase family enzyme
MDLTGIDHVAIAVRNVAASAQWYIDVLGFEPRYEGMWDGIPAFIGKGVTAIALFPSREDSAEAGKTRARSGMLHLAFGTTAAGFSAAQEELKQRGIEFEFQDHEISHSIYFRDPDGHALEITTYDVQKSERAPL